MPRQDVPYGGAICRLRERIAEIWDKLGEKLHSVNGVTGDAAGNVEIVSGDAAITISEDQVNHQIEIALDSSQLPAASVSSVNGQTGAVALDAGDINVVGGSNVQDELDDLDADVQQVQTDIAQEALARANADSALQTNINSSNGRISVLEGEDANNMKLDANQTATGDNTFSGRLKATGNPTYTPQQPTDDVATIATLDGYTPMVRTTNNQTIGGVKTFSAGRTVIQDGTTEMIYRVDSMHGAERYAVIELSNPNNNYHACLQFANLPNGTCKLQFYRYNTQTQQAEIRDIVVIS